MVLQPDFDYKPLKARRRDNIQKLETFFDNQKITSKKLSNVVASQP